MSATRAARRANTRRVKARRARQVAALSAFAIGGLMSTYVAAVRPAVTYAAVLGRVQPRADCPVGSVVVSDDTTLRAAVGSAVDGSVICVVSDIVLTAGLQIDDTTLTIIGEAGTPPSLSVDVAGLPFVWLEANFGSYGHDTLTIDNVRFSGAASSLYSAVSVIGAPGDSDVLVVSSSEFVGLNKSGPGAAIWAYGVDIRVSESTFNANTSSNPRFQHPSFGGAIYAYGSPRIPDQSLRISDSTFTGNSAEGAVSTAGSGGALFARRFAEVEIVDSTFQANEAKFDSGGSISHGGAIYLVDDDSVVINGSTFESNKSYSGGGAVFINGGDTTVMNSTFVGNSTDYFGVGRGGGGAVFGMAGRTQIVNSTLVDNSAFGNGGAVYTDDTLGVLFSTFVGNYANQAGAIWTKGDATVANTIFVENSRAPDSSDPSELQIVGQGALAGVSFTEDTSWAVNGALTMDDTFVFPSAAALGLDDTLGSNGGATETLALSGSSPLARAGVDEATVETLFAPGAFPAFDQRGAGFARVVDGASALGAFQPQFSPPPPVPSPAGPPIDVVASPGDRSAALSWAAPVARGSFPVSTYLVTSSPGGRTCLVSQTSCVVAGLTNGVEYTFVVTALTGAGWGTPSAPSAPVRPVATPRPVIVIVGSRDAMGRVVRVEGSVSNGPVDSVVPWVSVHRQAFTARPGVDVASDGRFTWSRRAAGTVAVYFVGDGARSNTVRIPATRAN